MIDHEELKDFIIRNFANNIEEGHLPDCTDIRFRLEVTLLCPRGEETHFRYGDFGPAANTPPVGCACVPEVIDLDTMRTI